MNEELKNHLCEAWKLAKELAEQEDGDPRAKFDSVLEEVIEEDAEEDAVE